MSKSVPKRGAKWKEERDTARPGCEEGDSHERYFELVKLFPTGKTNVALAIAIRQP